MTLTPALALLLQTPTSQTPPPWIGFFGFISVPLIYTIVKILVVFTVYMVSAALLTLAERKISAFIQDRLGPNRVIKGWGQPLADGVKNFMKEETLPDAVNKPLFLLAPALAFIPALALWAVIPFAAPLPLKWGLMDMVVADLPVGYLYILALASLGVYGIVLAGWSSNNKYALLGGLRSSAQMVSYEIAMGMSTIPVLLLAGDVSLGTIVRQQEQGLWNVLTLSIACLLFMVASFAETNRHPFDLPEAESELVAGYLTEYSGLRWAMFFLGEYGNMTIVSAVATTLFLGGWSGPGTAIGFWTGALGSFWGQVVFNIICVFWFLFKMGALLTLFVWVRATLPRLRADQLMRFAWLFLIPLTLVNILLTGALLLLPLGDTGRIAVAGIANWILLFLFILAFRRLTGVNPLGRLPSWLRGRTPATLVNRPATAAAKAKGVLAETHS